MRNLLSEAAGEESGLYERSTDLMFDISTLPLGSIHILMYNLSPEMKYLIPLNRKTINTNVPPIIHKPGIIVCLIIGIVHGTNIAKMNPSINTLMRDLNTFLTF
jgi:hypothetical protein